MEEAVSPDRSFCFPFGSQCSLICCRTNCTVTSCVPLFESQKDLNLCLQENKPNHWAGLVGSLWCTQILSRNAAHVVDQTFKLGYSKLFSFRFILVYEWNERSSSSLEEREVNWSWNWSVLTVNQRTFWKHVNIRSKPFLSGSRDTKSTMHQTLHVNHAWPVSLPPESLLLIFFKIIN